MKFTIPIVPKAQERDRITARGGFARSYKSKTQKLVEDKLLSLLMLHKPTEPMLRAVNLKVKVYLSIPKSKSRKWRLMALQGIIRPTTKPDCSNIIKNLEDVMNEVFFHDDRQIVDLSISKYYGDIPHWEIELEEIF